MPISLNPIKQLLSLTACSLLAIVLVTACGNGEQVDQAEWTANHGYGPITGSVDLGDLNASMAAEGLSVFSTYCVQCHTMESQLMGPALNPAVDRRTPEFIMNYILNPAENRQNHPVGQELAQQFPAPMINMGVNESDARAIYEYLRYYNEHGEDPPR